MKTIKYFFLFYIVPPFAFLFMWFLRLSLGKIEHLNRQPQLDVWKRGENGIFCFWHGRLFMMPFVEERKKCKVLVSKSKDGEFISRVVRFFRIGTIRASYKKASISSIKEIIRDVERGYDIAITPDGPKGPRYKVKKGIIDVAKITGKPIIPVSFSATKKKLLNLGTDSFFHFHFPR